MGAQYIDPMTLCHVCHRWQAHAVCEDCISAFAQPQPRCPLCALPQTVASTSLRVHATSSPPPCPCARIAPVYAQDMAPETPLLDRCIAALDYAYPWSDCITRLKFGHDVGLAQTLARLMQHTPWAERELEQADRIIPMPLSPERLQERGFNQVLELAKHLAHPHIDIDSLQRWPTSAHQVGADRSQRWQQVRERFWLAPARIAGLKGQRIVLLDDVMTTGATLYAAAHTLRRAGVSHLTALVLARTPMASLTDNARHVQHRAGSS